MMNMSLETTGKPKITITLPTIAGVCSIVSLVVFCAGWVTGFMTYTRSMGELTNQYEKIGSRMASVEGKVTETQIDVKYIGQSIAELKLAVVPKR